MSTVPLKDDKLNLDKIIIEASSIAAKRPNDDSDSCSGSGSEEESSSGFDNDMFADLNQQQIAKIKKSMGQMQNDYDDNMQKGKALQISES